MSFLGTAILILACAVAVYSAASALLDSRDNKYGFQKTARIGVFVVAGLLTLAEVLMLVSFYTHNFSLYQVANHSSLDTPAVYLLTGLWAGNAGALMFWAWLVALSGAIVLWRSNDSNKILMPHALALILLVEIFFLVLLFVDPPFAASGEALADGRGLSLVLQTPLMIIHPPVLLAGYALTTVPFALALAALFNRRVDNTWVLTARRWLIASWLLLGLGNILGMRWAYAALGWGGYWAWDSVENSGLMPWLLLTALLHSNIIYLRRGTHKTWTILLAIASFWLVILGAFITRYIPNSVHGFELSSSPLAFIVILLIVPAGTAYLLIDRWHDLAEAPYSDAPVSARNIFTLFNWIIVIATIIILIGTMLPFVKSDGIGQSYFNTFNLPVFIVLILLSGLCVLVGWGRRPNMNKIIRSLLFPFLGGVIAVVLALVFGWTHWYVLFPLFVLGITVISTLFKWCSNVLSRMHGCNENAFVAFCRLFIINRSRYGGYIVHIAIAIMALGIIGSSAYGTEKRLQEVSIGDVITQDGYSLTYNGLTIEHTPHSDEMWVIVIAKLEMEYNGVAAGSICPTQTFELIYDDGKIIPRLIGNDIVIRSNALRDVYVIFDDFESFDETSQAYITVMVKPLVQWIWIGGLLLLIGGALSFSACARRLLGTDD